MRYAPVTADPDASGPVYPQVEDRRFRQSILLVKRSVKMPAGVQENQTAPLHGHHEEAIWQRLPGPERVIPEDGVCLGWKRLDGVIVDLKNSAILGEQQQFSGDRFQHLLHFRAVQELCLDSRDETIVHDLVQRLSASVSKDFFGTGEEQPGKPGI